MTYKFVMYSAVYGTETFGGYDTHNDAENGLFRVRKSARELNDGIRRYFSAIEEETNEDEEGDDDAQS